ncbi:MAG: hypothetical protein WBD01_07425 [Salaquimonas sp.]
MAKQNSAQSNPVTNTIPTPDIAPFWYGSFSALWVYLPVPLATLNAALQSQSSDLVAYKFDDLSSGGTDMGMVNINFMTYASDSGINDPQAYADILKPVSINDKNPPASFGIEPTHEVEFNIVASSKSRAAQTPVGLSSHEFIIGRDHTKTIGNYRLWVPCDDRIAVYWGMMHFGENKVMTHPFIYNTPSMNNYLQTTPSTRNWGFTIPGPVEDNPVDTMFALTIDDLDGKLGVIDSNQAELIDLSLYPHPSLATKGVKPRLVASRRNVFGGFKCMTTQSGGTMPGCQLTLGNSSHPMVADMGKLLGSAGNVKPVGVMTYFSPPAVCESSLYYFDN